MFRSLRVIALLSFATAFDSSSVAHASPPPSPAPEPAGVSPDAPTPTATSSPTEPSVDRPPTPDAAGESERATALRQRAEHVRALIQGTLDPSIETADLFVVDLADPVWATDAGARLIKILSALGEPPPRRRSRSRRAPPVVDLSTLSPEAALETAFVEFVRLPAATRSELLAAHGLRREQAASGREARAALATRLARTQARAQQLRAYLERTLDPDQDPLSLLTLDLLSADEVGLSPARRAAWLASSEGTPPAERPSDPGPSAASIAALEHAQSQLDELRQQYLALSDEQRSALRDDHLERREQLAAAQRAQERAEADARAQTQADADARAETSIFDPPPEKDDQEIQAEAQLNSAEEEAAQAAAARSRALEAARRANTDAKRIVAEERARLQGVREAQARYEAELARRKVERAEDHDRALAWELRVSTLAGSARFESEKAAEADPLYEEIRAELGVMRERFSAELERSRNMGGQVPGVGEPLDSELSAQVDRGDLVELRASVADKELGLIALERSVGWELAEGVRDDVVVLNQARLALLEMTSPNLRRAVTGFGAEGMDQARREFEQISLEVGFFFAKTPHYRSELVDEIRTSTIQVVFAVTKLALLIAGFVWWRRRGSEILTKTEAALREQSPATRFSRAAASAVWYLRRVRRPLVVLAVIWGLLYVIDGIRGLPSLTLIWIAAQWILLGLAAILLVDAVAARETLYSTSKRDNSEIRIHSLRVVGVNVIAVGLILALTATVVGRGAIYSWVISTCWLLSFPVAIYLINRWKPIIFELIEERPEQTGFTQWVTSKKSGMGSFPAAAAGAAYLLGKGLSSWVMRQLSGLEATRRLLAYLFRRELAKQAAATEADGRFTPIGEQEYGAFDPEIIPGPLLGNVAAAELEQVATMASSGNASLSAVVGERGSGKSVFLERLAAHKVSDVDVHVVECPEEGIGALLGELARLTGQPDLRGEALAQALRGLGRCVIAIDDLQRLIVPAVNGLRGLDAFTAFERSVGGEVSWVVTIGSASWHYIRRARGERVSFEQVVKLPRWTESELGDLIQEQCERAKLEPSFEGLIVPRQNSAPLPDQGDRTEAGYYRLLWDFSNGNPAVALHAFRESLFRDESGTVVVRLFKEPPAEEVEALTLSVLFVLRTIVQLELALPREVEAATQLPRTDVEDAIRFCSSRGYLEPFQGGVRLSWPWYRTITTVLQRQHLLSTL